MCWKVICLKDAQIEQNPPEAPIYGIKISSNRPNENSKLLRFTNDDDAKSWSRVGGACGDLHVVSDVDSEPSPAHAILARSNQEH